MTIIRLGYVAMSVELTNCSPSQTMTYAQFSKLKDRDAGIRKLERISLSNLDNLLRLLKHNVGNQIHFFRFTSRLIPLAGHEELEDWDYLTPLKPKLKEIGDYIRKYNMRVDFHPDHFVLLNSKDSDLLKQSIQTLRIHEQLLKGMGIDTTHRCVLHVGGGYDDRPMALEQFVHNWGYTPERIQRMLILENDDTTFTLQDTLYLCEKLDVPLVFDYHHHLAHHDKDYEDWTRDWDRVVTTWKNSPLPIKMHISSPRDEKDYRAHADYIDPQMFMTFLQNIKGSTPQLDCMIEAKQKDAALFQLVEDLKKEPSLRQLDGSSFELL